MSQMCPYLDSEADNNFCGKNSRRLSDRHVRIVCETGSYDDCPSYNNEEYDSDHLYRHDRTQTTYEHEEENEHEYEYAEED